jgi:hypothetical protein
MRHVRIYYIPGIGRVIVFKSKDRQYAYDQSGNQIEFDTADGWDKIDDLNLGIVNNEISRLVLSKVQGDGRVKWTDLSGESGFVGNKFFRKPNQVEMSKFFRNTKVLFETAVAFQKYHG